MMRLHVPNNPSRATWDLLKEVAAKEPPGLRMAQDKWDGWRRPAYKINGTWVFQSKGTGKQASIPLSVDLQQELSDLFLDLDNIAVDTEWLGMRNQGALYEAYGRGYQGLRLLDLLYVNGVWMGGLPCSQRYANLNTIYEVCRAKRPEAAKRITVVRSWDHDWDKMFEENKKNPLLEGIVLKRSDSQLVGSEDNPYWWKIKYRDIHEPCKF